MARSSSRVENPTFKICILIVIQFPNKKNDQMSRVRQCMDQWIRRRACNFCFWNLNSTSNSPEARRRLSCQISANQPGAEKSANGNKHWLTGAKGNDVIANVITANQLYSSTFWIQIFKFQRRCCKLSFPLPATPPDRPGEFACRLEFIVSYFTTQAVN